MKVLNRTPLFNVYKQYGAKTIDFGGWELPVHFTSITDEHHTVRTKAGLFDVSHMGEFVVTGKGSQEYLQKVLTNDLSKLKDGKAQYTTLCNESGGTIDDLIVYRKNETEFLLVVNASNIVKDFEWMKQYLTKDVTLENVSENYAQLAIQGPYAERILQQFTDESLKEIPFFSFKENISIAGVQTLVARTGYTGEDGFELYCNASEGAFLWQRLLEGGVDEGLKPCGLGARDTLRFEAALPLYGQELSETISPLEAGIGFAVKTEKEVPFIGQVALKEEKLVGIKRKLVGIEMLDRGIPRTHYPVILNEEIIGEITTGTQSPTLKKNIGLALVKQEYAQVGQELFVEIRGKRVRGVVVALPFYRRSK